MSLSRIFVVVAVAGLATAQVAQAADTSAFQVLVNDNGGNPIMFQSANALKRGDVIKVHAFNARLPMILQVAMCDSDCPHMHLIKTMQLFPYYPGTANMNKDFVVPENGRVSFWVQDATSVFSMPITSRRGAWGLLSFYPPASFATPQLFEDSPPISANAVKLDDNAVRARYNHDIFVAISLADASI